ncbi:MAG: hypothetical protein M0Z55_09025 [Peptococcaceae bacterium]|nr:hypothetical protein [Peptococcaceae bacterium]
MYNSNLLPKCILCGETPPMGIMDGVVLRSKFLCHGCEQKILDLDTCSIDYDAIIEKLKILWVSKM